MKLDKVNIMNFRSIEDVAIDFNPQCRVLVGINESGKSNVLKALSFLSDDYDPSRADDLRDALPDEDPIDESKVEFVFKFEKVESDELFDLTCGEILCSVNNPDIVSSSGRNISLRELCNIQSKGLYTVDIIDERKFFQYYSLHSAYKLISGWKKPKSSCPKDLEVEIKGEKYKVSLFKLIRESDFKTIPKEYLEDATLGDLSSLIGNSVTEIVKNNLPDTLFWEYDEDNLLPNSVDIDAFIGKPDSCIPLKNMFSLASISDIKKSVEEAKKGTNNQFQNFLNRVAKKTTNHFKEVWKEYKSIEFSLRLNGNQIIPGVKEKNTHDFARRSDGFKRFVTFLLIISVNVRTDKLKDTLLLVDEPDISLHPSGARYLRDELIRISKTNYVVYSTHSIFMIDPSDIGRHYIVKKKNEITTIEAAKESNIADEEVLYNSLGYSVFSILKENILVFEGWYDKQLFQVALEASSATLKAKFKDITLCHAKGVKSIKAITPMIELAKRKCLILSDSDKPAKEQQKIYQNDKGYGEWKTYQEIDSSITTITGEDFIKNDFISKQVKSAIAGLQMPAFSETILPETNKIETIFNWLNANGMTKEQSKDTVGKIKNNIFDNLRSEHIESSYSKLLKGLTFSNK